MKATATDLRTGKGYRVQRATIVRDAETGRVRSQVTTPRRPRPKPPTVREAFRAFLASLARTMVGA